MRPRLFHTIRTLFTGRSVLVPHRFSTARDADVIYVMAAGRIIESGSHRDSITGHLVGPLGRIRGGDGAARHPSGTG